MPNVTVSLTKTVHAAAKEAARNERRSLSKQVELWIAQVLAKGEKKAS